MQPITRKIVSRHFVVSSGLAYAPAFADPLFCATKAYIHPFTSIPVRGAYRHTAVKVVENTVSISRYTISR